MAVTPSLECDLASSGPAAAFEHSGEREILGALAQAFAHEDRKAIDRATALDELK